MDMTIQREKLAQERELALFTLAQQERLKMEDLRIEQALEEKRIARKAASGDGNVKEMTN
jgi:hypothetical protein